MSAFFLKQAKQRFFFCTFYRFSKFEQNAQKRYEHWTIKTINRVDFSFYKIRINLIA